MESNCSNQPLNHQIQWKKELIRSKRQLATFRDQRQSGNCKGLKRLIFEDPISWLLLVFPYAVASYLCEWPIACCFWLNFLAMIPLAKLMGDATEELAAGLRSETTGGLLNATFGNAAEMILTVQTLRAGQIEVVKSALLGSVLSNLLLILGTSFLVGGMTPTHGRVLGKQQRFFARVGQVNVTMLLLATAAVTLPTLFFNAVAEPSEQHAARTLQVSRWCSVYIFSAYMAYILFQLFTHAHIFQIRETGEEEEKKEAEPQLTVGGALSLLGVTAIFVSVCSQFLAESIDGFAEQWGVGRPFIGIVLMPMVANACEHAGAVRMAMVDKLDIAIGIAVGSSTQIALLVVPFAVLAGWMIDQEMDLNFGAMDSTVLVFAVLISFSIITDGTSSWLEGFMLLMAFFIMATLYWFFPDMHAHHGDA